MIEKKLTLINELGLHARASAKLVSVAAKYLSNIHIHTPQKIINVKNIMELMLLAATKGTELHFRAEGKDEKEAMQEIETLLNEGFGEEY